MGTTATRSLRLLLAALTVWCLGCDAFEIVTESFTTSTDVTSDGAHVEVADDCQCALGHVAVVVATTIGERPTAPASEFVASLPASLRPARQPPLRPPVA